MGKLYSANNLLKAILSLSSMASLEIVFTFTLAFNHHKGLKLAFRGEQIHELCKIQIAVSITCLRLFSEAVEKNSPF